MITPVTRRAFLAGSATAVAALAIAGNPATARVPLVPEPPGPVYGRTGSKGIAPGTTSAPSKGDVILLDGRVLKVSHVTSPGIGAGKSVFLAPKGGGRWSILYAEC